MGASPERRLRIGVYGARGVPSTYSGFETFLTAMLPALVARGHDVTMYCRRGEVPRVAEFRGVRLRHTAAVPTKNLSTLSHGLSATLTALRDRHDVLLVVNVANAPYCALATRLGVPVVLNTDGQEWLRGKWGQAARSWFLRSAAMAGRSATALVADGTAMREVYLREFGADSTVIPYAYTPADDEQPAAARLQPFGLRERGYLVTGGRLAPENNVDTIVARHVQHGGDLPIVVMGEANYDSPVARRLEELAEADQRVRLLGHIADRATYFALLRHAARYLHGHSVGGTNPSLIEAMGAGARIAALDTAFNRETLGVDGELFAGVDASLDPFLRRPDDDDVEHRQRLADRARHTFRLDDVTDAYEELLLRAAAAHPRDSVRIETRWTCDADRSAV